MSALALVASLLFGVVVGVLSGLVGIGGGAAMVPFLYALFAFPGFSGIAVAPGHEAVVAHATSLMVIVPTALSGLRTYQKSRLVDWSVVLPMAVAAMVAAVVGALVAERLPPQLLKAAFGVFLVVTGTRLLRGGGRGPGDGDGDAGRRSVSGVVSALCGVAVGLFSALMGVGGGLVAIPLLIYVVGLELRRVAATSIGLVVFAAVSGTLTYLIAGWDTPGLPPWTLGYVFAPAALALLPGAVVGARWGAMLNQKLDAGLMKVVFAVLFLAMGLRLILGNAPGLLSG